MNGWYFAFSQIKRNSLRSGLMAAGIIIAAAVITAAAVLMTGINEGISNIAKRMGADVMVEEVGQQSFTRRKADKNGGTDDAT